MAFESIRAQIALLLGETTDNPEDWHELSQQVHRQLDELRGFGMPVPADLEELENALELEMQRRAVGPTGPG